MKRSTMAKHSVSEYMRWGGPQRYGNVIEEPGPYFAGALGTLIPAGGRLLLAMAEQLLRVRGISYVFMDTDSIVACRPDGMSREEFRCRVQEVVDFFLALNPYREGGSLLAYEDQNYATDDANPNAVTKALGAARMPCDQCKALCRVQLLA